MIISIVIAELIALYVLSRRLTQNLYVALFLVIRNRPACIAILSTIFFPGTVIHELAHLFVAEILGVRTSGLTLVPEGIEQTNVRTGSVSIAQSDPIRRALIGVAPVYVGLGTLFTITYFLPGLWEQTRLDLANGIAFSSYSVYVLIFCLYSLFAVSNSMFASPEDLEGFWPVFGVVAVVVAAVYFVGIRITLPENILTPLANIAQTAAINVGGVVGLNLVLLGMSHIMITGVQNATGRKFIRKQLNEEQ